MKYEDVVEYIDNIPKFTSKNSLEHTRRFLEDLGIKQDESNKMKIIHVAGTNGKGTVCAILSNVLVNCGKKTGLFISPHLVHINERIRINNKEISDEEFVQAFNEVKNVVDKMKQEDYPHPSYFEFLFLSESVSFDTSFPK